MKKFLLVCAGVGLAIGGGYLMYQGWRKYYQGHQGEDNDQDENTVSSNKRFLLTPETKAALPALRVQSFSFNAKLESLT